MTLAELMAQGCQMLQSSAVALGQGTLEMADEAAWLVLWRLGLPWTPTHKCISIPCRWNKSSHV